MWRVVMVVVMGMCAAGALPVILAPPAVANELRIFAAASLTELADALAEDFQSVSGQEVHVVAGASSTLARQIEKGAPADVFLSASKEWADYVARVFSDVQVMPLFGNELVIIASKPTERAIMLADLPNVLDQGRLAVGDPAHVPAGQYAQQAMEAAGIWEVVKDRLAPASDVRGALTFVAQGAAPFGIVYATDAMEAVFVVGEIDPQLHQKVVYYAVLPDARSLTGQEILRYLSGPRADAIAAGMGFLTLKDQVDG